VSNILRAPLTPAQIAAVGAAAREGKIVAFPTDTVYGLGSSALAKDASKRIYEIKGRHEIKPLPIFVHSIDEAKKWVEWTKTAQILATTFWPGPLTLVLNPTKAGRSLTPAEYESLAIRVPNHALLCQLLEASGVPWVQTSANRSGFPSLTNGIEVADQFSGAVDWIVDGGATGGLASTIADARQSPARVLREGAIKAGEILSVGVTS
jgi:L-threonylcarbamoyladenylate synthase